MASEATQSKPWSSDPPARWALGILGCGWAVVAAVFVATNRPWLRDLVRIWWTDQNYQFCFVVPAFSLFLLWWRRNMIWPLADDALCAAQRCKLVGRFPATGRWWSVPLFAAAAAVRCYSVYFHYNTDHYSLFPLLAGLALLLGGWRGLHWAWPAVVMMVFVIPLPGFAVVLIGHPLRRIATVVGVYVVQTVGIPAIPEGTIIKLGPEKLLDVKQACSGIALLTLFFACCVGAVFVIERKLWEKCLIVVSAIPIAIIANVARITVEGIVMDRLGQSAFEFVHHWIQWAEMLLALLMLWGEMWLIAKLLVEPPTEAPLVVDEAAAPKGASEMIF